MNYIQKLLNGEKVEWNTLGEVADIVRGQRITKTQLIPDGEFPVISGGIKPLGFFDKYNRKENIITIAQYGSAGYVNYIKEKFWANDVCYSIFPKEIILNKYLYYCLVQKQEYIYSLKTEAIPAHLPQEKLSKIPIPIPPLAVQQKIAEILDRFAELEAELEAELHLREKQYNYYRNHLLTPNEQDLLNGKKVEWKSLGEVILHLRTGLNPRKNFVLNTNDANNYYITVRELGGTKIKVTDKTDKINDEALKIINNRSKLKIGDILFSGTGTIGSTAIVSEEPKNWNIKEGVYAITPNSEIINSMFLLRLFQSESFVKELEKKAMGGIVKSISMADLQKIQIPIPSIEEQERIVKILDKFDTLVNSISEGLPKEIALRRKQYEYYREQLLSF